MRILVTGANGFIGRELCRVLLDNGFNVRVAMRNNSCMDNISSGCEVSLIGDLGRKTIWDEAVKNVDTIVHLAGLAHVFGRVPIREFHNVNVVATERLARSAVKFGVRRLVYVSSIGVNGDRNNKEFTELDMPNPDGPYAISKYEAEKVLLSIGRENGLETVILRPTLVYGANPPGNFKRLLFLVKGNVPLPFKGIKNKRDFIYIGNLVDAILNCIRHPKAANETFLLSDGESISTPDLITMIAEEMGRPARLFSFPYGVLRGLCSIIGKREELDKLAGPLLVDSSKIRGLLGWKPPFTLREGIRETVRGIKK